MLNVLIIHHDIVETVNLINYLSQSIPEVRISNIQNCGTYAIDVITSSKPDLILVSHILPDTSGIGIINYLEKHNFNNYLHSIILLTNSPDTLLKKNPYIYACENPKDYTNIVNDINHFIEYKFSFNSLENKLYKELHKLKFDFSHIGTQYLIDSISFIFSHNLESFTLKYDVFPRIAQKYHTNVNTIKCDILNASLHSYYECDENFLSSYFRLFPLSKPNTKYIISTILDKLKVV